MVTEADASRKYDVAKLQSTGSDSRNFADPAFAQQEEIDEYGKVNEIIGKHGGTEQLCNAVNQLQSLLYAA